MNLRKIIFWAHLLAGLAAGLVIFFMAATGFMLAYERQILAVKDGYKVSASSAPLPLEALLVKVHANQSNDAPSTVILKSAPNSAVGIGFGKEKILFYDPSTAAFLGEGAKEQRAFFEQVTTLHRFLGGKSERRELGKAVTGAACTLFFFLICSGIYLWWPGRVVRIRFDSVGKARHWNWHNAIGFWCGWPLLLTTTTGIIMSYSWVNNLLFRVTGNTPPPERKERGEKKSDNWDFTGLDKTWITAQKSLGPWQTVTIRLPREAEGPVTYMVEDGNGGRPDQRAQITVDGETGEVTARETFTAMNLGKRLRLLARFAHTGEAMGIVGQTVMAIGAIGAMFLVWTGFTLAGHRFFKRTT